jgi:hypothetical protein
LVEEKGGGGNFKPKSIRLSTIHLVASEKNGDLTLISQSLGQYIRAVYGLSSYTCSSSFVIFYDLVLYFLANAWLIYLDFSVVFCLTLFDSP